MSEATVRLSALDAWTAAADELRTGGRNIDLTPLEFEPGKLSVDGEMPLRRFVEITESITAQAGDPLLGWTVGLGFDIAKLGEIGEAVLSSRRLGGALQRIVDYFSIIQDAGDVRLEVAGDAATLSYRILDPDIWPRQQDALFTLGIFAKIIRSAIGPEWSSVEIMLETNGQDLRKDASKAFGARYAFNGETNFIRLPARLLDNPIGVQGRARPANHARLSRQVAIRRRRMAAAMRVRLLIFQDLNEGGFSQESVAKALGMSSRTLRRRLAEEGVSFQGLLDECRMRLAAFEFQVRPNVSIAQTALRLGYSEHSTFTRAFLRWKGMPPQSYIRQARSDFIGEDAAPAA